MPGHRHLAALWFAIVLAAGSPGCDCGDDDDDGTPPDASSDAPAARDAGHDAAADAEVDRCCPDGGTCCPAPDGGLGQDVCVPDGEACPTFCDGCAPGQWCQREDPAAGVGAECLDECDDAHACPEQVCCPVGTACDDVGCPLPDLTIDAQVLADSVTLTRETFAADSCEIAEACIGAPGERELLRFSLKTPNVGEGALFLGAPSDGDLFEYSDCHRHYHFKGYARYRLLDLQGNEVAAGHKQAFCLEDYEPLPGTETRSFFDCSYQGIQAGWADVYRASLPCQWIDVTGVPPGDYVIEASVNFEHNLPESDYDNDVVTVPYTLAAISCPAGCVPEDEVCCADGDPCGWAGNGSCDCQDAFGWDGDDCGNCDFIGCAACPYGCSGPQGFCCQANDPCGYAEDGWCDCQGEQDWDHVDCANCADPDPDCRP